MPTVISAVRIGLAPPGQFLQAQAADQSRRSGSDRAALALFANNFSNLCFRIAWELAENAGLDPRVLLPLIDESCAKLHTLSPAEAQTGPAVRWDENVMNKHLALLEEMPQTAEIYKLLSSEIHRLKK